MNTLLNEERPPYGKEKKIISFFVSFFYAMTRSFLEFVQDFTQTLPSLQL